MEKDKKLTELIREHGIVKAPDGFSSEVLEKIEEAPVHSKYKPIISRFALLSIIGAFVLVVVIFSQILDLNSQTSYFSIPEWDFNFPKVSPIISTGFAAGIMGILFLMLAQIGLKKKA